MLKSVKLSPPCLKCRQTDVPDRRHAPAQDVGCLLVTCVSSRSQFAASSRLPARKSMNGVLVGAQVTEAFLP